MSLLQNSVVDYLADNSRPQERKSSVDIAIAMNDIVSGNAYISDFSLSQEDYMTSEGKTYLALLPAFAIANPESSEAFTKAALNSVENMKRTKEFEQGNSAWSNYKRLSANMRNHYNEDYIKASEEFYKKTGKSPINLWDEYLDEMDKRRININQIHGERLRSKVIKSIRDRGLNLPGDWELNDKETFLFAAKKSSDTSSFSKAVSKKIGQEMSIEPGLSWSAFVRNSDIQKIIKNKFNNHSVGFISMDLSKKEFFKKFVYPESNSRTNNVKKIILAPVEAFKDEGVYETEGKDAVKRVKVPVISIGFSCFFAILNLLSMVSGIFQGGFSKILYFVLLLLVLILPFNMTNKISSSKAFNQTLKRQPNHIAYSIKWITNAQPFVYPIGEMISNNVYKIEDYAL